MGLLPGPGYNQTSRARFHLRCPAMWILWWLHNWWMIFHANHVKFLRLSRSCTHVLAEVRARVGPHKKGPPEVPQNECRRHSGRQSSFPDLFVIHIHIKRHIKQHVKISNFDVFHVEFIISAFIFHTIISVTECFLLVWSILLESIRSGGTKYFFKFEFGVTEDKLIDVSKYCFYCNISRWVCDIVDFVNKNVFSQIDKSTMWYGVNLLKKSVYEGFYM